MRFAQCDLQDVAVSFARCLTTLRDGCPGLDRMLLGDSPVKALVPLLVLWSFASIGFGADKPVDNFKLLDHRGEAHELYYHKDAKAIVLMVHGNGCPIVRLALPRYREIRDQYQRRGVRFALINANLQDERDEIAEEARTFHIDMPVLLDETQLVAEMLDITRTAEVIVIDPRHWTIVYRGAIDDRISYETQQAQAKHHWLTDALDDLLADRPVAVKRSEVKGCIVNLPETSRRQEHAAISYSQTIAPLLIEKCVICHRPGGIGPFAMDRYARIRGFAPMIREVLLTRRMPPWHADAHVSPAFTNDRSLTADEMRTLVHWIEAGAPRGDGPDPLAERKHPTSVWQLGEPDIVVDIPPYDVPATGVVPYQYQEVANPFDRDVWVRAVEYLPGSRQALHHVITTIEMPDPRARNGYRTVGSLGGYVPGTQDEACPPDTGIFLPKGAILRFQMHYTTFGRAVTDRSKLGIHLHGNPPQHRLESLILVNTRINIPAGARAHQDSAKHTLERDVMIYSLLPHAHYRGKASRFTALLPDGREKVLLSVPDYNFNWQTTYHLREPIRLPKGTTIVHTTMWDNSANNPANPDPTRPVRWGEQSWDEMLFGAINYRALGSEEE